MINYKLLTPGPLTTTETVKREMMVDHCTWDDDYKQITQWIRRKLLKLAGVDEREYTAVLMQGSGTFGVESVLTSAVGREDHLLIAANGAYGLRMAEIARQAGLSFSVYETNYDEIPDAGVIGRMLAENPRITHVAMVHSETTSGILNDIEAVSRAVKAAGRTMIVDAMSSFGGVEIPVGEWGIDFIISSANKCIQGVPGFSFIVCRREALEMCRGRAKSLSLDLYGQWKCMELDGKWRYTSPTHGCPGLRPAIREPGSGGRNRGAPQALRGEQPSADLRPEGAGFSSLRWGGTPGAHHHHLFLPGGKKLRFSGNVRLYQGAGLRHLSGQGDGCRDLPGGQYRRNLSPGYGKIVRDSG